MQPNNTGTKLDYFTYAASGLVALLELVGGFMGSTLGGAFLFFEANASAVTVCVVVATFLSSQLWNFRNDRRAKAKERREAHEHRLRIERDELEKKLSELLEQVADNKHCEKGG